MLSLMSPDQRGSLDSLFTLQCFSYQFFSLFMFKSRSICLVPQVINPPWHPFLACAAKKDAFILERDKSFADVGSLLCLCTSLVQNTTLDINVSPRVINNLLWFFEAHHLVFLKQLIESASPVWLQWFSSPAQLACYGWEVLCAFIHQLCFSP